MDCLHLLLEAPQPPHSHEKCPPPLSLNPFDNCRLKTINCAHVKSQPHFEACETSNSPCQSRDQERYFAEPSRKVTRASADLSPVSSRRSSSQTIEHSEDRPARSDSDDASRWYWGPQASLYRGHTSPYASSLPLYDLSSTPKSNQDRWFSSPLMGSAWSRHENGGQQSNTSSLLQFGNDSLPGYYTSYGIADTSNSLWNRMLSHVLTSSNPRPVNMPHPKMPVYRQDGLQSPNYLANDPKAFYLSGSSSALEIASSSVQRAAPNLNSDPDDAITQPIVDPILSLREHPWPLEDRMYLTANTPPTPDTHGYSTHFPLRPAQYKSDSLTITFETASVSPHQQSPSPRPHTIASHLSLSPSSPGSLSDVFTVNSLPWQDVEIAESKTSPEVPSSVETDPESATIQQERTRDRAVAEEPNYCHHCRVSFTQPQGFRRHLKDMHEDKESCTHCSSFKWSRGRPYLYRRHLRLKHSEITSSEDRLRRTPKSRTVGACQRNIPNRKTEATSGSVFPRPYRPCHDSSSGPSIPSPR